MALDATPNFRVNVYGTDPGRVQEMQEDMLMGGPRGGSGGFPWFRGSRPPSPYNPNGPTQTTNPPEDPYEDQGPPDQRKPGGMFAGMTSKDILELLAALTGTVGAIKSNSGPGVSSATTDPAMQEVLNIMSGRLRKSEPMFDSVQAMTNGLLPTAYQRGNFTPFTDPGRPSGGGTGGGMPPDERGR